MLLLDWEIHMKDDCDSQLYLFSLMSEHIAPCRHPAIWMMIEVCTLLGQMPIYIKFCHNLHCPLHLPIYIE